MTTMTRETAARKMKTRWTKSRQGQLRRDPLRLSLPSHCRERHFAIAAIITSIIAIFVQHMKFNVPDADVSCS